MTSFFDHSKKYGAKYQYGEVIELINHSDFKKELVLSNGTSIFSKTVLIASGMKNREPNFIENIEKYYHNGVSFCAICDGHYSKTIQHLFWVQEIPLSKKEHILPKLLHVFIL